MNAFELADALEEYNNDGMPVYIVGEAIELLRDQAERVALLEKRFGEELNAHHSALCRLATARRQLEKLKKEKQ